MILQQMTLMFTCYQQSQVTIGGEETLHNLIKA